jgi:hypothetical protein
MEYPGRPSFAAWVSINCFFMLLVGFIGTLYVRRLGHAFPASFFQGASIEIITLLILLVIGCLRYGKRELDIPIIASMGALAGVASGIAFALYMSSVEKLAVPSGRWQCPDEMKNALIGTFLSIGLVLLMIGLLAIVGREPRKKYENLLASLMLVVGWLGIGLSLLILVG